MQKVEFIKELREMARCSDPYTFKVMLDKRWHKVTIERVNE
jgi:hypothetical protein